MAAFPAAIGLTTASRSLHLVVQRDDVQHVSSCRYTRVRDWLSRSYGIEVWPVREPVESAACLALTRRGCSRVSQAEAAARQVRRQRFPASPLSARPAPDSPAQPSSWRDTIRLVVEPLGVEFREIAQDPGAQQVGMDRDAIGAVRADHGEMGHPDRARRLPIRLMRCRRSPSPGKRALTSSRYRRLTS